MVRARLHSVHLKQALCHVWAWEGKGGEGRGREGKGGGRGILGEHTAEWLSVRSRPKAHTAWCVGHVTSM